MTIICAKAQVRRMLPTSNLLQVVFHQERFRIKICDEESHHDINKEESVDDTVDTQKDPTWVLYKPELER